MYLYNLQIKGIQLQKNCCPKLLLLRRCVRDPLPIEAQNATVLGNLSFASPCWNKITGNSIFSGYPTKVWIISGKIKTLNLFSSLHYILILTLIIRSIYRYILYVYTYIEIYYYIYTIYIKEDTKYRSWFRHYDTSRKIAGRLPMRSLNFFSHCT
jgi:hypothetical protein